MELTELESWITHKRIGRPEVPAATDFKGSRYGGSGTFRAGTCRCYPKSGHVQSNSACLLSAPPHMRPPKSVQHLIGSNLHFSLTKLAAMSALGQKRTCAVQKGMSALPPKADIARMNWHVR